ncbi:hypothetical protein NQ318_020933 [Aromia moschata]|uniref:Uncharacterized protein n=1 Tax=Aromia moschata TaxID=1265417 RepID=A0AAV8XBL6_9CUCU|nr:hypothetical protein NQ318_020933 [Aromia moschata]
MNYQDHLTKFVFLRALKSKRAEEVAYNLMDIFCITGAPLVYCIVTMAESIQRTPYEAMFGTPLINGLTDSNRPLQIVERLQDEEDIYRLQKTVSENMEDTLSDESDRELLNKDNDGSSNNLTNDGDDTINEPENDIAQEYLQSLSEIGIIKKSSCSLDNNYDVAVVNIAK